MEKPFDASIEQLAHDLALLRVAEISAKGDCKIKADYYKNYVSEYAGFKHLIENDIKNP